MILQLLVGTYGGQIYKIDVDSATFELSGCDTVFIDNASYLACSADGRYFYAISESGADSKLSSFSLERPYELLSQLKGVQMDPCFVMRRQVNSGGEDHTFLLTGDYSAGSISVYPVSGGKLEPAIQVVKFHCKGLDPVRQPSSHIHQLKTFSSFLFASDLGGDRLHVLKMNEDGGVLHLDSLYDVRTAPGSGPRHMEISEDGSRLYLLTEMSREILVYSLEYGSLAGNGSGVGMNLIQTLFIGDDDATVISQNPLEPGVNTQSGGDIHIHPDGKVLYASLRNGADKIAVFDINADGTLKSRSFQRTALHPRNFTVLPDGRTMIVPCKNSDLIQFFNIDPVTGALSDTGKTIRLTCPVLTVPLFKCCN